MSPSARLLTDSRPPRAATRVGVAVSHAGERVTVTVCDDGAGGADAGSGTGLRGLADRVDALGGTLAVDSPPGAGTCLTAELPCAS